MQYLPILQNNILVIYLRYGYKTIMDQPMKGGNTGNGFDKNPQNINRNGRAPKEFTLTNILRETLNQVNDETGKTKKQEVIDKMYELAVDKGDVQMMKYLIDRIDGKPLQTIEANVTRPETDLSNLSKKELKNLADLNRKRKS